MDNNKPILTEFDQLTLGNVTQIIKIILPLLDFNLQKNLSMLIRILELKSTIDFYNHHSNIALKNGWAKGFSKEELIKQLAKYYPNLNLDIIDNFSNIMQMESILSNTASMQHNDTNANNSSENDSNKNSFSFVENWLNEEQQKTYEELLKNLDNINIK